MGILVQLSNVTVHGRRLRTVDYLSEHAEKLVAAMTMKQLPNELVIVVVNLCFVLSFKFYLFTCLIISQRDYIISCMHQLQTFDVISIIYILLYYAPIV